MTENFNLAQAIWRYSVQTPQAIAIVHEGHQLSYGHFAHRARTLATLLSRSPTWRRSSVDAPRVAILAERGTDACVAIAGVCWAGASYVPLNIQLPEQRILEIFKSFEFDAVVADFEGEDLLTRKVRAACPTHIIHLDEVAPTGYDTTLEQTDADPDYAQPAQLGADKLAYIIFTSGTSWLPKGVMITAGSVSHYLKSIGQTLQLQADDRVIETCDFSLNASVHNMFTTWQAGATLYILPTTQSMNAVRFAREARLTVWNSVPPLAGMLRQVRTLSPACLPDLRITVFGGEALSSSLAASWAEAAPNSRIINLYGSTEATIYCMQQEVTADTAMTPGLDFVSIGRPLPGNEAMVLDAKGRPLADGLSGELAIAGMQLAKGYMGLPIPTAKKFPVIKKKRWYLTGDYAVRDPSGDFHCLGRMDNQIKLMGNRIELEEIDTALRKVCHCELACAVGWPVVNGTVEGIVGFVVAEEVELLPTLAELREVLPPYMVPDRVIALQKISLNQSGKVDRPALLQLLAKLASERIHRAGHQTTPNSYRLTLNPKEDTSAVEERQAPVKDSARQCD
jgi:D-alanine--poly(phosphoribitol) ligase subunit 1